MEDQFLDGFVDKITVDGVLGWACVPDLPAIQPRVTLYCNGEEICETATGIFREDLKDAGYGNGNYGFLFPLHVLIDFLDAKEFLDQKLEIKVKNLVTGNFLDGLKEPRNLQAILLGNGAFLAKLGTRIDYKGAATSHLFSELCYELRNFIKQNSKQRQMTESGKIKASVNDVNNKDGEVKKSGIQQAGLSASQAKPAASQAKPAASQAKPASLSGSNKLTRNK